MITLFNGASIKIALEFKLEDFWIGVFWGYLHSREWLDIYVCVIPMLPIHIGVHKNETR